jgi:hypothetical protein
VGCAAVEPVELIDMVRLPSIARIPATPDHRNLVGNEMFRNSLNACHNTFILAPEPALRHTPGAQ